METFDNIEELKYPQENSSDELIVITLDDLKNWKILVFKQFLNDQGNAIHHRLT